MRTANPGSVSGVGVHSHGPTGQRTRQLRSCSCRYVENAAHCLAEWRKEIAANEESLTFVRSILGNAVVSASAVPVGGKSFDCPVCRSTARAAVECRPCLHAICVGCSDQEFDERPAVDGYYNCPVCGALVQSTEL